MMCERFGKNNMQHPMIERDSLLAGMIPSDECKGRHGAESLSAVPAHPDLLPWGEGTPLASSWIIHRSMTRSSVRLILGRIASVIQRWDRI